jgi:hypothetical protein
VIKSLIESKHSENLSTYEGHKYSALFQKSAQDPTMNPVRVQNLVPQVADPRRLEASKGVHKLTVFMSKLAEKSSDISRKSLTELNSSACSPAKNKSTHSLTKLNT